MTDLGKIDRDFFDEVIYPNLGADRDDVVVGPQHGVDFGVLSVGDHAVVLATDPVSILPDLGWERAGRLALEVVLADVAVSGVPPTHLAVSLSLPPDVTDDELTRLWRAISDHAADLGVSVASGHTARYPGIDTSWVGGATALGVGDPDDVVRPDGARPGDDLVISTGPAAEVTGLFATLFPEALGLDAETVATAQERVEDVAVVADARAAFESGDVTAMHDATEGGIQGGLAEMADGAGVRFDLDREAVPVAPGVEAVCDAVGIDPWAASSAGTLLIAVADGAGAVVDALESRGTPAAVVGEVSAGEGVYVDGERVRAPDADPAWAVFRDLSER
ncbi:AIR synthase family protein [Halomicrobium salinisoli]|uniref:AIR synthase family protein n=1 Tax=Halomicrobium salinisoli TaxID=2878391 RepID=UPI001CEFBCB0|nr:AIR synthase family protein [Halomicrobium salinisoli]